MKGVSDLRSKLKEFAYRKCSREMENFSSRFRDRKKGDTGEICFEFDCSQVDPYIRGLVDMVMEVGNRSIMTQDLVSEEGILEIAERIGKMRNRHMDLDTFMAVVSDCGVEKKQALGIEICARVIGVCECLDVQGLLIAMADSEEMTARIRSVLPDSDE
jgi:hypothetical protein